MPATSLANHALRISSVPVTGRYAGGVPDEHDRQGVRGLTLGLGASLILWTVIGLAVFPLMH